MKYMNKIHYIIFALLIVYSCSLTNKKTSTTKEAYPSIIVQQDYLPAKDNTPFTILDASINKDILSLIVQYGGGCKEHYFNLFTKGVFEDESSNRLRFFLEHNYNEDFCKKLVLDTLDFSLRNKLSIEKIKSVEIEIDSYSKFLNYKL